MLQPPPQLMSFYPLSDNIIVQCIYRFLFVEQMLLNV